MALEIIRRACTIHDYAHMRERGILTEEDRVELIDGEIRVMNPIGPHHAALVSKLVKLLNLHLGDHAVVSPQNPIRLDAYNEPQPDIAVLHYRADYYATAHPTPGDIFFLVEVADTTMKYDRDEKLPRYAAAGIAEVWLINVGEQLIEQYWQPTDGYYASMQKIARGDTIIAKTLPQASLSTNMMLG